ncbi:MAG TPA: hypothetical protein DCL38_00420 [Lachnospiraceae bacterium]|nr:hypothetical protein [Lachnospiraceae bacterium]
MTIGEKLAELRRKKKLTQAAVAKEVGIPANSYSRWESGANKPGNASLKKLSDYYGEDLSVYKADAGKSEKKPAAEKKADRSFGRKNTKASTDKAVKASVHKAAKAVDYSSVELQYAGKAIPMSDIVSRAKEAIGNKAGKLDLYIKTEENRVYYVCDGNVGSFEI